MSRPVDGCGMREAARAVTHIDAVDPYAPDPQSVDPVAARGDGSGSALPVGPPASPWDVRGTAGPFGAASVLLEDDRALATGVAPFYRAPALRPVAPSALPAAVGLPSSVLLPVPSASTRSAALVPLVAALVAGMARVLSDEGGVTVVEASATGAGVAATGVAGWTLWRASSSERAWLGRLTLVLAGWTVTQLIRVGLGPAPTVLSARAAAATGALAAPLLAAIALVTLPRPVLLPAGPTDPATLQDPGTTTGRPRGAGTSSTAGPDRAAGAETAVRATPSAGSPAGAGGGPSLGMRLATALGTARRHGWDVAGFDVHYQPIVRLTDGAVVALEALARWTEPDRGPVPPLTFVAAAEDGGLVAALDEFVLARACAEVAAELPARAGAAAPRLHVNISASRLADPALPDVFGRALAMSGLEPSRLVIEITETSRIRDLGAAARLLEAVRALGPSIAMDDVGAGYTTLAALHQLPVNVVKLDRELIENPLGPGRAARLARSVITVARSLGAVVVAEGIERRAQRADLALLGCELGQGYLFARPGPLAGLGPLLSPATQLSPATLVHGDRS